LGQKQRRNEEKMEICSFEELYTLLAEALYHAGCENTVKRHDSRLLIVELEAGQRQRRNQIYHSRSKGYRLRRIPSGT